MVAQIAYIWRKQPKKRLNKECGGSYLVSFFIVKRTHAVYFVWGIKNRIMKNYRFVAYDAANGDYEEFETLKEAQDWLTENDGDGISQEACDGQNYIAEIQYHSVVTTIDEKENYHVHTDDCPDDCDDEEWPYDDDWAFIGKHSYEKINWDEELRLNNFSNEC